MKSFVLEFFIAARFANLAVSLPQYQFASHRVETGDAGESIEPEESH
jgi:hypothetical protein